jgi:hypothetical protein
MGTGATFQVDPSWSEVETCDYLIGRVEGYLSSYYAANDPGYVPVASEATCGYTGGGETVAGAPYNWDVLAPASNGSGIARGGEFFINIDASGNATVAEATIR